MVSHRSGSISSIRRSAVSPPPRSTKPDAFSVLRALIIERSQDAVSAGSFAGGSATLRKSRKLRFVGSAATETKLASVLSAVSAAQRISVVFPMRPLPTTNHTLGLPERSAPALASGDCVWCPFTVGSSCSGTPETSNRRGILASRDDLARVSGGSLLIQCCPFWVSRTRLRETATGLQASSPRLPVERQ